MEYVVGLVALFLLNLTLIKVILHLSTDGVLRIDHSNPKKDTYRFEINNLDRLSKKKRIVLKIDNHANLSQE